MKKVLLVNCAATQAGVPHTGLAMLSAALKQHGHLVRVADYHLSEKVPAIDTILEEFSPDVVGISLFSWTLHIAQRIVEAVKKQNIPLMCGGPHTASYYEELAKDSDYDYIVMGEAEDIIAELAEAAVKKKAPELIHCPAPDVTKLPLPDYASFYGYEDIRLYPIITSRGCPFSCSFCSICLSNSRQWRPRLLEECLEEIRGIEKQFPFIKEIMVWDDNFSLDIERAKRFLKMFLDEKCSYKLSLANVRADRIDREFLMLLKQAGCEEIQFGVEHGNPEVFRHIEKKETLEDIKRAAKLVNDCGMRLGCSFIIGLPYDSLQRTYDSIRLAQELKADHIHWNLLVPYKGTRVYEYFKANGIIDERLIPCTLPEDIFAIEPNVHTDDFTKEERKKAYIIALLLSKDELPLRNMSKTVALVLQYKLFKEFCAWFFGFRILRGYAWKVKQFILGRNRCTH